MIPKTPYVAIVFIASLVILGRDTEPKTLQLLILVVGLIISGWFVSSALNRSQRSWTLMLLGACFAFSFFHNEIATLLVMPLIGYSTGRIVNASTMTWTTAGALAIGVFEGFSGPESIFTFSTFESFSIGIVIFAAIYLAAAIARRRSITGRPNP